MPRIKLEGTYYSRNKERLNAQAKLWHLKNRDRVILRKREQRRLLGATPRPHLYGTKIARIQNAKNKILENYGKTCACCNEANIKLLTVDHINNNAKEHGSNGNRYKGYALYAHLIKLNYPTGIQILCFNCNIGRKNNKGVCPHKDI